MSEKLKLIRWADDGYPPIKLGNHSEDVIALIKEVRLLRIRLKLLKARKAMGYSSCPEWEFCESRNCKDCGT